YLSPASDAAGGGLCSSGALTMAGCTIQNNTAIGGRGADGTSGDYGAPPTRYLPGSVGGDALGGGLYIGGGTVTISGSTLTANTSQGGAGGNGYSDKYGSASAGDGGNGLGGGLYAGGGVVSVQTTSVTKNTAQGGAGGAGAKT